MAANPQRQAAKKFVEYWTFNRPGREKSGDQQFWNSLLGEVLGVTDLKSVIKYQEPVQLKGTTKYLDAWIPSTRVLIEHKSRGVKLDAPQPGHDNMTPFEQAKFYDDHRPFDEKARWIVTCNFDEIWIYDQTKPLDPPEKIALGSIPKEVHRLSFLVNASEKKMERRELEISVQAGRIVATLYDALLKQYAEPESPETLKALNKLCVRLVFCFYAEDSDVFEKNIFRKLVAGTPAANLRRTLVTLFENLNTPDSKRDKYLEPEIAAFPYTNGGLFKGATVDEIPPLTEEIKNLLISSSDFDWSGIDTTIFGALFESTLNPQTRRAGGMVYTSSENIHRLIDPMFLNELEARFEKIMAMKDVRKRNEKLRALQDEIASLTFLDPACGSGNFMTETYICLRRLENKIIAALQKFQPELDLGLRIKVSINQFHGIEINDFAVTVAMTAMWISEAKMLRETADILHRSLDFLPLKEYDGIVEGNALRMNWNDLLRRTGSVPGAHFNYIIGNPPFVGAMMTSKAQKEDMLEVFGRGQKMLGEIDYVAAWYKKASDLIRGTGTVCGFVSTNSVTQGQQASSIWPGLPIERIFAWQSFVWDSEASEKAHVHVVIIGFVDKDSPLASMPKRIFGVGVPTIEATHINAYLMDAPEIVISSRTTPLCDVPRMNFGNMPRDGGNLIIEAEDYDQFIRDEPQAAEFIRPLLGSEEFINGKKRYCLWLVGVSPSKLMKCPKVLERIEACRQMRLASKAAETRKFAETPALFCQITQPEGVDYILVPGVSSERRKYVPMGFIGSETKVTNLVQIVPNANKYHFGVLTSSVHMAWMRAVAGRLETRYRYSKDIVYNNFPWPTPNEAQKTEIERTAQAILDARAKYPDDTFAQQYGEKMYLYTELCRAHAANDMAVLKAYGFPPETTDAEIVARLFELYAKLVH